MRDADPGYELSVVTPATEQPVSLAEAKTHLRVLHSSEDTLISRYVAAASGHIESMTGRSLVIRTLKLTRDAFPSDAREGIRLRMPPIAAVTDVKYLDTSGIEQTLDAADYYLVRHVIGGALHLKPGKSWPQTEDRFRAVAVTYSAGYASTAAALPASLEDLRNAILLLTEHFYYHRSAVAEQPMTVVPMAVEALIGPHKTHGWI